MNIAFFDRLAYTESLKNSGVDEKQALAHANALDTAMRETVATKQDIDAARREIDAVRREIEGVRQEIKIASIELDGKITAVRSELKAEIDLLRSDLGGRIKLIQWMLVLIIVTLVYPILKDMLGG